MRLIFLGTGGYHPNERRHTACLFLPEIGVVLDAGTGIFRLRGQVTTKELDVFLSHAHLDHVCGLTYLLGVLYGQPLDRITVHGDPEKLAAVRRTLFDELIFPVAPPFEFRPIEPQTALPQGGRLRHFPLAHPGGTLGFRLDWPGRSLAYVTDTHGTLDSAYLSQIAGVDVLVHECNFGDEHAEFAHKTGHSYTSQVAKIARQAKVGRLILTHFEASDPRPDPIGLATAQAIFSATELAEDLMEIEF